MVEWSREYYIDPATTGLNAVYRSTTGGDDTEDTGHGRAASVNLRLPPSESNTGTNSGHMLGNFMLVCEATLYHVATELLGQ